MIKREYAKHLKEFAKSDAKKLTFNCGENYDARICFREVRNCIERNNLNLTAYRVYETVYVEKI